MVLIDLVEALAHGRYHVDGHQILLCVIDRDQEIVNLLFRARYSDGFVTMDMDGLEENQYLLANKLEFSRNG